MSRSQFIVASTFLMGLSLGPALAQATNSVTKTITIQLDKRYGLHLHNSIWNVNLGSGTGTVAGSSVGTSNCYRAGEHSFSTGRDVLYNGSPANFLNLFNFARFSGDTLKDDTNPYSQQAALNWYTDAAQTAEDTRIVRVSSYPGFEVLNGVLQWKGSIMCILNTTLEVFSNQQGAVSGNGVIRSRVQATLNVGSVTNFPKLVLNASNAVTGGAGAAFVNPNNTTPAVLGTLSNPVSWQDFSLIQALVFDGTETAASSGTATLTFTLADFTPL